MFFERGIGLGVLRIWWDVCVGCDGFICGRHVHVLLITSAVAKMIVQSDNKHILIHVSDITSKIERDGG